MLDVTLPQLENYYFATSDSVPEHVRLRFISSLFLLYDLWTLFTFYARRV